MHTLPAPAPPIKARPKIDLAEVAKLEAEADRLGSSRARHLLQCARDNHADGALFSASIYQKAAKLHLRDVGAAPWRIGLAG